MSKRDPQLYLRDILDSINKIAKFSQELSYEDFKANDMAIDAIVRNLEIIGEAARNMPAEVKDNNTEIPWEKMVSMRNKILHEYFGVDLEILWKTTQEDLPVLKVQIEKA